MENKNILKIQSLLKKYNTKLWILVNKDNNDKIFCKYISKNLYTKSIMFIFESKAMLLINIQDKDNMDVKELIKSGVKVYVYSSEEEKIDIIEEIICSNEYVNKISFSYSTMSDKDTDIILSTDLKKYKYILRKIYRKYHKKVSFSSSEKIVYSLISENSEKNLNRIKLACKITEEILEKSMSDISIGMSELDISDIVINSMKIISKRYIDGEIIKIDVAWEGCPFVLAGQNLSLNGHTPPSTNILRKGDLLSIDFGIKAIFSDGKKVYSDMQRMGYASKSNEKEVPRNIRAIFDTLKNAIDDTLDYMKPDVKGYVIDTKLREKISNSGYPLYTHASGHPVGNRVHASGAIIGSKLEPRAGLGLVETGVYTLEPRIALPNGASIEEMIEVTKYGGIPIYKLQKELYIIK